MIKLVTRTIVALLAACVLYAATPSAAHAAGSVTCTVTNVEVDNRLMLDCGGVRYYANGVSGTNCSNASIDFIKIWDSTAISALLSGKTVSLWVSDCATRNFTSLKINN
jgi:hypothetical protein